MVDQIRDKLDNLPPGEEKDRAVEEAHEQLDNLKKAQGLGPDNLPPPAPRDPNDQVDPNKLPPPQGDDPKP